MFVICASFAARAGRGANLESCSPLLGHINTPVNEPVQLCPRVRRDLPTRRQPDVIAVRSDVLEGWPAFPSCPA